MKSGAYKKEVIQWDSKLTLRSHRNAPCSRSLRSQKKQGLMTNTWSSTESTKQKSITIF